jgi:hypothetical protein
MTNFEAFQQAVRDEKSNEGEEGMGYMGSLMGSMGLVLEEFYHHLDVLLVLGGEMLTVGGRGVECAGVGDEGVFHGDGGEENGV